MRCAVAKKKLMIVFQYLFFAVYAATVLAGASLWYGTTAGLQTQETSEVLKRVLPPFDNFPLDESFVADGLRIFPARSERQVALEGTDQVITASSLSGFAFLIPDARDSEGINPLLIGLNMDGDVTGAEFLIKGRFLLPENRIPAGLVENRRRYFSENRPLLLEKASEGAVQ